MGIKIGFIGTGNIGASLVRGVVRSKTTSPDDIYVYDVNEDKVKALIAETGVHAAENNLEVASKCDFVILAVKPVFVMHVLEEIKDVFTDNKVLVSVAAGITTKAIRSIIGENKKVIRTMPNLPVLVGEGMTLISFDDKINDVEKEVVRKLFEGSGKVEELEESLINEVISLTSSSPAYVFVMIEAMGDGAVQHGIPRHLAYKLAAQAVLGSAKMVLETGLHPAELKDRVCTPAGTTIRAIMALEKNGFRHAIVDAMNECTKRALELGRESESR